MTPGPLRNPLADMPNEDLAVLIEVGHDLDPTDPHFAEVAEAARRLRSLDVIAAELARCDQALGRMPYGGGLFTRPSFLRLRQRGEPPVEEAGRLAENLERLVDRLAGIAETNEDDRLELARYRRLVDAARELAAEILPARTGTLEQAGS